MSQAHPSISLFELNNQVKSGIREILPGNYWVVGEISEMNVNQSGHCYIEFIEKKADTEQIIARAKATIWAFTFRMLKPYFESVTGQRFSTGLKVMVQVAVEFHEVYGYSLNIKDIEPNYTVGDLTRKRQEIIKQLQDEGVFHLNKELDLPLVPQRIAVISSETAAGYGDFVDQLKRNKQGYKFTIKLFNAYMQGNDAEQSIISALEKIFNSLKSFDLVVIIRGGGSQADLNCFNSYWLSYHITQFPLPVLTGIGHERDETIADLVAHTNLKTPTAVAEFILTKVADFDEYVCDLHSQVISLASNKVDEWKEQTSRISQNIVSYTRMFLAGENQRLKTFRAISNSSLKSYLVSNKKALHAVPVKIRSLLQNHFQRNLLTINHSQRRLLAAAKILVKDEKKRLARLEQTNHLLDPVHVLKRGYTITYKEGRIVKSALEVKTGDSLTNFWHDGNATSKVD